MDMKKLEKLQIELNQRLGLIKEAERAKRQGFKQPDTDYDSYINQQKARVGEIERICKEENVKIENGYLIPYQKTVNQRNERLGYACVHLGHDIPLPFGGMGPEQ